MPSESKNIVSESEPPPQIPFEFQLLTKDQLAAYFSVEVRTVEIWMKQRKLPFRKIGGSVRFMIRDILSYLDRNCLVPAHQHPSGFRGRMKTAEDRIAQFRPK